jgi:ATP-dependent Clp protease ATP-binding subunit ClpC
LIELFASKHDQMTGLGMTEFLLPLLESGDLLFLAETTPDALAAAEAAHSAFVRMLQRLPIAPLSPSVTQSILDRAANTLARERKIGWAPGAVPAALDVVARFGDVESLPGSGLSLLEQMVSLQSGQRTIDASAAIRAFSRASGFPEPLLDPEIRLELDELQRFFAERVIGQPQATRMLTRVILLLKAGLNDPAKPLGSFLFMGPTGVGKTEAALTLAEYLFGDRARTIRLDMSELGYPGAALRLVDGPGGEGELTKKVREQPFSVILFDEIEKADPSVFDLLLQILGEGRLTDGTGRTVRFTHSIIILTSNLGAGRREPIGFSGGPGALEGYYREAVEKFFRPELVNRIDHLVPFTDLDGATVAAIARKLMEKAIAREGFSRRRLSIEFTGEVLDFVARAGFDPRYGARPLKRAIEEHVIAPLARHLAAELESGREPRRARLFIRESAVAFELE